MSAETAGMIRTIAKELGYESHALARALITRWTHVLALGMPNAAAFWGSNPFNLAFLHNAAEAAAALNFSPQLEPRQNSDWHSWDAAGLSHRRIAGLSGPEPLAQGRTHCERYREALVKASVEVQGPLVAQRSPDNAGRSEVAFGRLAHTPRRTALLAFNDKRLGAAIDAAHQTGLDVPAEISVVGLDDHEFVTAIQPPLTPVRYPAREIGAEVVEFQARRVQSGDHAPPLLTIPTQLVVRETCAMPAPNASH